MPDRFEPRIDILPPAQREILLATKLKAILDRAEAKDYRDISAMLSAAFRWKERWGHSPGRMARIPDFL
jgi:hypothetical protein